MLWHLKLVKYVELFILLYRIASNQNNYLNFYLIYNTIQEDLYLYVMLYTHLLQ
jgi:hypothetical protein